ncbi:adenylate/guanylate cyclase domain-containing protein [Nocardioides sp. MH1]|uniref:adenylate/guanylate cyclase domain-containing protein n=1 Tax=Nocardioides sp. MH1 TaxID=3242490 RepID=UPI0035218C49
MRFWDLSSPEVAAADAEPWDGPMARVMRTVPMRVLVQQWVISVVLSVQASGAAFVVAGSLPGVVHPAAMRVIGCVVLAVSVLVLLGLLLPSPRVLRRYSPLAGLVAVLSMGFVSSAAMWAVGPHFGIVTVFYLEALPFAFYLFELRWALLAAANAIAGCGVVMFAQDGWAGPVVQWATVASTVVAVSWILGVIAQRADRLATSEHAARLEVAELNRTLEERVATQVEEIERLGGLRRFLTPQVADAVLSADGEELIRPHRQQIAVFFCDLRGFTAFTKESEPEEVVADLDQYYRTVGEVLQRHGATIGGYAGDGIMAYLGDPVPHAEPARAAVAMVADLRAPLDALVAEWQRRGHDLSYGIGLAYGYATLGVVGFDGRYDYTPLGGVVNLAARLCGGAASGQVLVDHATYAELDRTVACAPVEGLELKGLGTPRAYALG